MRQTVHALFENDDLAHAALQQLTDEGLADATCTHRCTYDRLEHSPAPYQTNILVWSIGGAIVMAHLGAIVGAVLGYIGWSSMGIAASTMLGTLGFGSMGGLACTIAGAGSHRPDLVRASRGLTEGRLVMSFAIPESRLFDAARRRLEDLGALTVTPGVLGAR